MSQMISAVGGLWPLALVLFLFVGMLIFKRQIATLLERLSKFSMKRGQAEFVIESSTQEATVIVKPVPATVEPPKQEETTKELPAAASEKSFFGLMAYALAVCGGSPPSRRPSAGSGRPERVEGRGRRCARLA